MNNPGIQSCESKVAHASHSEASTHSHALRKGGRGKSEPYRCNRCGSWHVGGSRLAKKIFTGVLKARKVRVFNLEDEE
jgi:hypothetical protein